jgi:UDP-N-acetylglucosamine acyltransferase
MAVTIHPTAIVDSKAQLGDGTTVGAYSIVGPHVVVGANNWIGPHVVLEGHTTLGDSNKLFQFCSIGSQPQDLKFKGEPSELRIGSHNIIREFVTLQPGTEGGGMLTSIGNRNLFMANTHVGHDSIVGDRCILANSAGLSGHVTLGNGVVVGGLSGIHQFVRIGDVAMIGAGAMVTEDIPPFCMAQGDRAKIQGLNRLGLERNGASPEDLAVLRKVYRAIFRSRSEGGVVLVFKQRIEDAKRLAVGNARAEAFVAFLSSSERGIASHRGGGKGVDSEA